jgi:hypothetical protein
VQRISQKEINPGLEYNILIKQQLWIYRPWRTQDGPCRGAMDSTIFSLMEMEWSEKIRLTVSQRKNRPKLP